MSVEAAFFEDMTLEDAKNCPELWDRLECKYDPDEKQLVLGLNCIGEVRVPKAMVLENNLPVDAFTETFLDRFRLDMEEMLAVMRHKLSEELPAIVKAMRDAD